MDPPDRRQVWEAPSPTRSNAGYLTPPLAFSFPHLRGVKELLPVTGNSIESIGWLVSDTS